MQENSFNDLIEGITILQNKIDTAVNSCIDKKDDNAKMSDICSEIKEIKKM